MITASSQVDFYREFLMRRGEYDPSDFGVDLPKSEFVDMIVGDFNNFVKCQISLDEFLLHPEMALEFCHSLKRNRGWYSVPNDILLRSIMARRKNPTS
jgi:hypothetical protein